MQELEGDLEEVRGLGEASPRSRVGVCGLEGPGLTGRCSWNETGRGLGGGTRSGWIREEPVLGTAPPRPYCEPLAKWQLLSFLDLVQVSGHPSALPFSNPIPPQPQWALGS